MKKNGLRVSEFLCDEGLALLRERIAPHRDDGQAIALEFLRREDLMVFVFVSVLEEPCALCSWKKNRGILQGPGMMNKALYACLRSAETSKKNPQPDARAVCAKIVEFMLSWSPYQVVKV